MSTGDQRIQLTCTTCQTPMSVPFEHAGKMAKCPSCQSAFTIPTASPTTPSAPATDVPPVVQPPTAQHVPMAQAPVAQQPAAYGYAQPQQPASYAYGQPQQPAPYGYAQPQAPYGQEDPNSFPELQTESMTDRAYRSAADDVDMQVMGTENPYSAPATRHRPRQRSSGAVSGAIGGSVAMLIAVVWFFGGLAAGVFFIYPPILFVLGLIGVISALAGGGSSRRRRY